MGCPSNIFHQTTCNGQAWGAAKALFCKNIMEAREAREHESDSKQNHQVEGPICMRRSGQEHLGGATSWSTYSQSNKASMSVLEKNRARRSKKAPKPMGPGRTASPLFKASDAPLRQLSLPFSSLFVCLSL
jgi:hypothetical protein